MTPRPYALLAELTYRCPLHCPYCSNPTTCSPGGELSTEEWSRVIKEAAVLGVMQVGFSGGEPLARKDLAQLISNARAAGLYTNLLTSAVGLTRARAQELRNSGLDSLQISFQADEADLADKVAGTIAHARKLEAAQVAKEEGLALGLNVVLHRENIDRLPQIIALAETLGAERLELANVQYYGWAFQNRAQLLPTRAQVKAAAAIGAAARGRLRGKMDLFYVLPDYYGQAPKPCMQGWGQRYITVNPLGEVLPCPTASSIPGMHFENVREQSLAKIWRDSESFNRFRGTEWMPEPCRSCARREIDFGGCRCQAALLAGDASATDPVCALSPHRGIVDKTLSELPPSLISERDWIPRQNPRPLALFAPHAD